MQRWIVLAALMLLLGAGGAYVVWNQRQNKPDKVWTPIKLSKLVDDDEKKALEKRFSSLVRKPETLLKVVKALDLVSKFGVASEEEAVKELSARVFVETGPANPPTDQNPALNIGVQGKRKEAVLLRAISSQIMRELAPYLPKSKSAAPAF